MSFGQRLFEQALKEKPMPNESSPACNAVPPYAVISPDNKVVAGLLAQAARQALELRDWTSQSSQIYYQ